MARQSLYDYKKEGVLDAVLTLTEVNGRAPSLREIASVADCSVATLHSYLQRMRSEGLVEWSERSHRSLRVVSRPGGSTRNGHVSVP